MNKQHAMQNLVAAGKANLDTMWALTAASIKTGERLLALNMDFSQQSLKLGAEYARKISSGDWEKWGPRQDANLQKGTENASSYLHQVYKVCIDGQADTAKVLSSHAGELGDTMSMFLKTIAQSTPGLSESTVDAMRSAILHTHSAYSNLIKSAAKQMTEAPEPEAITKKAA